MAFQRRKLAAIGTKAAFPGFIEPALASSIEKVPGGERWLHEIKFDGYGVQVHLANEAIRVLTRRGNDWTKRFRKIADDAGHIAAVVVGNSRSKSRLTLGAQCQRSLCKFTRINGIWHNLQRPGEFEI